MTPSTRTEIAATVFFGLAIIHTFLSSKFRHLAHRFGSGSVKENFFHLLGEVEVVFGFWAGCLLLFVLFSDGSTGAVQYAEGLNFTEPLFVLAIMAVAATRPIVSMARRSIVAVGSVLPVPREIGIYACALVLGPLMGSFITEPAAMTVTALILKDRYFERSVSDRFKYVTLAVLFVNISIGGVLTPYAAPPVLMVAAKWQWTLEYMLMTFAWKAVLATLINAFFATAILFRELRTISNEDTQATTNGPAWLAAVHVLFLIAIVLTAHHPVIFLGLFLFFLGVATITEEYQDSLKIRESLLVSFFLCGLVVLGGLQKWWLDPLLRKLDEFPLFLGTTLLTAITDNAALTYLGSQVEGVSDGFKYALVAGAIAGGGLTVIANAPNPAGYSILQDKFGPDGIKPMKLLLFALPPTLIAATFLWGFR